VSDGRFEPKYDYLEYDEANETESDVVSDVDREALACVLSSRYAMLC